MINFVVSFDDSLQQDDICYESQTTIEKVNVCPKDIETINTRSNKKNCSRYQKCDGHELVYHCVINGGGPVEVCAPRRHITGTYKLIIVTI